MGLGFVAKKKRPGRGWAPADADEEEAEDDVDVVAEEPDVDAQAETEVAVARDAYQAEFQNEVDPTPRGASPQGTHSHTLTPGVGTKRPVHTDPVCRYPPG